MPFQLFQGDLGYHYFRLKADNGEVMLQSQAYTTKEGAENGIIAVIKQAPDRDNFELKEAKDGSLYFTLKAANGQNIGRSEMYKSKTSRDNAIKSVQLNAKREEVRYTAKIEEIVKQCPTATKEAKARELIEQIDGYAGVAKRITGYGDYHAGLMAILFEHDYRDTYAVEELAGVARVAILSHCRKRLTEATEQIEQI